ncbi:MAG: hypothetical protein K6A40_00915 [Solobacterium sp.]|nr:hypothetical protein [Solobacterium sp.]
MKKLIQMLLAILLSLLLLPVQTVNAAGTLRIAGVTATFLGDTVDVMRKVMEIDGGTAEKVILSIETKGGDAIKTYTLIQYDGNNTIRIASSQNVPMLSFDPTDVKVGYPLYLDVKDNGGQQNTVILNFRINTGEAQKSFPDGVYSEFGSGIVIDLSSKLPGCKFSFLPFVIPLTVKRYGDGRVVLGLGMNYKDADFWADAAVGKYPGTDNFEKVRDAVLEEKGWKSPTKNVGLLFSISGWAEANVNPRQPCQGKVQIYVGTGWATGGQYVAFTWDVIVTVGASGAFDFSMIYNEAESKRDFMFERILLGAVGALEAFGGIGLYSLASVGIYGAGSLGINFEFLPKQEVSSLVLAGEMGFKVKVLGKSILTFTLISGSHDFLKKSNNNASVNLDQSGCKICEYLLANNYGNQKGETLKSGDMIWHGGLSEEPVQANGWEDDPDFAHLLAEDIYPDSHVQIVNTGGKAIPQMNIVFLGSDNSRVPGNRSILMNSYLDLTQDFLSDPYVIDDDGTADFDPVTYWDDINQKTYLVWRDAREEITEDMTLTEVAERTEVAFSEFWIGSSWYKKVILTDYAGKDICAVGARPGTDDKGNPVVTWFTTSTEDPAALGGNHEVWLAVRDSKNQWHSEKQFEIYGAVTDVRSAWFAGAQSIAVTMTDACGRKIVSLWQNRQKVWEQENAGSGKFGYSGYNYRVFSYFLNGKLYTMNESMNSTALTPDDLVIPSADYELYGKFGSKTVMLVGRGASNNEENAFAILSRNGGTTWSKIPLTDIDSHALVDHISIEFTEENEPIVVYSVQNYISNFDESRTVASNYFGEENKLEGAFQNIPMLSMTGSDLRFTDTKADLYIKARKANSHIRIADAYAPDVDSIVPDSDAEITVALENTGIYELNHADIICNDKVVGTLQETILPGETKKVTALIPIPKDPGSEPLTFHLEATSRESGAIESVWNLTIPGGHLEASVDHLFENLQEELSYKVTNYGYTDKTFEVLVRDEERGVEISREKFSLKGGETCEGAAVSKEGMYVREGCKNATIYVLFEGEDYDSDTVEPNRIRSVIPLDEIYGQKIPSLTHSNPDGIRMYRLYNPNSGEHFFTAKEKEKDALVSYGWSNEGIGWYAPAESETPVYRLYNAEGGEHHYTTNPREKDALVGFGWTYEGIGWFSDDDLTVPLYRVYNPNAYANNHHFTRKAAERDALIGYGWRDEGIGWYGTDPAD